MSAAIAESLWSRVASVVGLATTPLSLSHFIEPAFPLATTHTRNARVLSIARETPRTATIALRPGRGFRRHRAGQWVQVGAAVAGRILTRPYSITSPPERSEKAITITVKAVPGGRLSNHLVSNLKVGSYVTLGQPEGEFVLPEKEPQKLLFITAGSGITPVMSMLRSFEARGAMPDTVHVHYEKTTEDALFRTELLRLAAEFKTFRFTVITTEAGAETALPRHFGNATLGALATDFDDRSVWACGPEGLISAVEAFFAKRTLPVHVERFRQRLAPRSNGTPGGVVRFLRSGKEIPSREGASLLELAESVGICAPNGCRMGICHSCDTTLEHGLVRDLRTDKTEGAAGDRVRLCVSAPCGDVAILL